MAHEQRARELLDADAEKYQNISRLLVELGEDIRDHQKRMIELLEQLVEVWGGKGDGQE